MRSFQQMESLCSRCEKTFMQSKSIDEETRIYIRPTAEMRKRLRLMDLKPWELLKGTKPAFGDVRAPRQWYESAKDFLINEAQFLQHPLDNCVFLSVRIASCSHSSCSHSPSLAGRKELAQCSNTTCVLCRQRSACQ